MTPKEKANEIGNKFYNGSVFDHGKEGHLREVKRAKECATLCVEYIIIENNHEPHEPKGVIYWNAVIQEIAAL